MNVVGFSDEGRCFAKVEAVELWTEGVSGSSNRAGASAFGR